MNVPVSAKNLVQSMYIIKVLVIYIGYDNQKT